MPTIIFQAVKEPKHDAAVKSKIFTFLQKLGADDTTPGLHIEPMEKAVDSHARTARVDLFWRAVLFRLDPPGGERAYVYAGTWPHDEAIKRARTTTVDFNPVNGLATFRQVFEHDTIPQPTAQHMHAEAAAPAAKKPLVPILTEQGFFISDLVDEFGFDSEVAAEAFQVTDEDTLVDFALTLDNAWQQDVITAMGAGVALHLIKQDLGLDEPLAPTSENEDARILEALKHPAARMQFTFIEDDQELRQILDDGDFGAWRIFLHPEQRKYAEQRRNGSFRLTGGAGTGKTVVLLHRARRLAQENPTTRIILTTFTRALAENLRRDLERLDHDLTFAEQLGDAGILVRGVDQLAAEVRTRAGADYAQVALVVLGATRETTATPAEPDWKSAMQQVPDLSMSLRSTDFFAAEYSQIVLPHGITSLDDYLVARRAGRGVALDRSKRIEVWSVIERMRKDSRVAGTVGYGEIAAVSAQWLRSTQTTFADNILIDEAQDLEPAKWKLLRALAAEGPNDLFIADDTLQRIYGQPTVLKRYGISVQGRSRRLTLNYRTTLENLQYAIGLLEGVEFSDAEEAKVTNHGYRSARSGPKPATHAETSDAAQFNSIADDVRRWIFEDVAPETIAILAASNASAKKVQQALSERGISVALLTAPRVTGGQPVAMTMHTSKGMEFSRVVLFDVSDGQFPPPWAYKNLPDEDKADRDKQFRSLLYVAASRARDELVVTWKGSPSRLLGAG